MKTLLLYSDDDVALAVTDLAAGHVVGVSGRSIALSQPIPPATSLHCDPSPPRIGAQARPADWSGHGQHCPRRARSRAQPGKLARTRRLGSAPRYTWRSLPRLKRLTARHLISANLAPSHFGAIVAKDGRVGVRNHVLVLATVSCANAVVEHVGQALPEVVALPHVYGCSQIGDDLAQTRRVLEEFAAHPNVGAAL